MIEVKNVSFAYGKIQALRDVSFKLDKGEVLSLIGANGAGKSTLMKCVAGLLKPQQGEITYNGEPLHASPHEVVRKGIVLVPEGRWIFPALTVEENLILGGYTVKDLHKGFEKAYSLFPVLKDRKKQRAGTLSGGEQQMLAIGRGLMSDPSVLLLDEPSLGIAPILVNEIYKRLKEINELGVSILLVEQNAKKPLSIATHAFVMQTGKFVYKGTGAELLKNPDIVKAYLGGKVEKKDEKEE